MQQIVHRDSAVWLWTAVARPGSVGKWDALMTVVVDVGECTVGRTVEAQSGSQWLEEEEEEVPCGGVSLGEEGPVGWTRKRIVAQADTERAPELSLVAAIVAVVLRGHAAKYCPAQAREAGQATASRQSGGRAAGRPRL